MQSTSGTARAGAKKNLSNCCDFHFGALSQFDVDNVQKLVFQYILLAENVTITREERIPMATHPSVDTNLKIDQKRVPKMRQASELPRLEEIGETLPFRAQPDVAPVAVIPIALADKPARQNLRRIMTREQGRVLEMIGHAVDYLNDCYLREGDEDEIINVRSSSTEAIQILISLRWQILQSLPLQKPRMHRLWNALFHRSSGRISRARANRESKPISVVPLSSSR